ncbi:MAG TPA: M64 family metallopeptidase [Bacteroidales bacterium]|nr:M64 family metallopeptidase [Bacteroidales bacterium]
MRNLLIFLLFGFLTITCIRKDQKTDASQEAPSSEIEIINTGNIDYSKYFVDKTMRLDYFHTGTASEEHFAIDMVVSDGIWSGSKKILIDALELGPYFFEVIDRDSKVLLYSRGFGSVFGEWQTIPEAGEVWGTFHESLRFPWPMKPVTVIIRKRNSSNTFSTVWTTNIDPASRQVNPAELVHSEKVFTIAENGPADKKVDLVILGDGYTREEMGKFREDAERLSGFLMSTKPFSNHASEFNIRAIETPSPGSGVSKPHHGVFKRTPLAVHYSSFDSERYALTYDNKTIRNLASAVPYDIMVILLNERTYGGGGIYNLYTTVSSDNSFAEYIMIHEMGHHIAALADEYYTSSVAYEMPEIKVEPWETNITALFDKNNLKWKDLLEPGTPVPTPWNKDEFDKAGYAIQKERDSIRAAMLPETVMEDLFRRQLKQEDGYFSKELYRDKVGAFEGAGYMSKGLYRPQIDCIMYTRHLEFCKVCSRTIEDVISQYVY